MISLKESKQGWTFDIKVTPSASRAQIDGEQDGVLKVKVTSPPVEGAANEACIKLLAGELKLKKSQMEIISGSKSKRKIILVRNIDKPDLEMKIKSLKIF